jgi:hypothetical protein
VADHPVKVPPELVKEWRNEACGSQWIDSRSVYAMVADKAAQWGWDQRESEVQEQADQELEAVEHWLITGPYGASIATSAPTLVGDLRAAMRPKPPTLAEQGCNALDAYIYGNPDHGDKQNTYNTIRAALNRLAELEAQQ